MEKAEPEQREEGTDPTLPLSLHYHAPPYADPSSRAVIAANQKPECVREAPLLPVSYWLTFTHHWTGRANGKIA